MKQNKETIKGYFETGDRPTQEQYHDTWDSFWHKDEVIPEKNIEASTSLITTSGRIILRPSLNWSTNANDSYGLNYHSSDDDCGSGDDPNYSWTQLGHTIPSNYKIKRVIIIGRSNKFGIDDVRFQFVKRVKNDYQDWQDSNDDLGFTNTVLYDGLWMFNAEQISYTGLLSRKAKRVFEMDTTNEKNRFDEDGEFFMYLKPVGSFTENAYFQYTLSIEIEKV